MSRLPLVDARTMEKILHHLGFEKNAEEKNKKQLYELSSSFARHTGRCCF